MIDYHLLILNTVGNIISCISCLKVLLFPKHIRAYNLIMYVILLCDFVSSLTDALSWFSYYPSICVIQVIGTQFFALSSFLLIGLIIWYIKKININDVDQYIVSAISGFDMNDFNQTIESELKKKLSIRIGLCFAVSGTITIIIFGFKMYGRLDDTWCWITDDYKLFRILFYNGIIIAIWLYSIVNIVYIIFKKQLAKWSNSWQSHLNMIKIYLVSCTIIFIVIKSPSILYRFLNYAGINLYWLLVISTICNSLIGFVNALLFEIYKNKINPQSS